MIKLPSLFTLWQNFRNVLFRFPLQGLIALTAVVLLIWANEQNHNNNVDQIYKLIALCNLAFTLSLSANLYAESRKWLLARNFILQLSTLIVCAVLFVLLSPQLFKADLLRLFLFILSGHLLVSFSVYYLPLNVQKFWHFNKILFLRFLTAVLFSIVLFGGLAIALLTIETLFNYEINGKIYFRLFAFVAVGFNTIFFLAGIPDEILASPLNISLPQNTAYPKVLKIFTQYVLIPLLTIYFVILVVYELKIAVNAELPDGMVSILILGYAVFGILSYLLIYPISRETGNEWMHQFSKLFFWLMAPLLILLFVAIWVRVSDYGLTEMRYFIILMALWLTGITLYFVLHRTPSIQIIPISLFAMVLLSTYGPQSAASLSEASQQSRLLSFIKQTDDKALQEKISIINYLVEFHGLTALQAHTAKNLKDIEQKVILDSLRSQSYLVTKKLKDTAFNILSIDPNSYHPNRRYYNFLSDEKLISGNAFDYIHWLQHGLKEEFDSPLGKIKVSLRDNKDLLIKVGEKDSVLFNIIVFERKLLNQYQTRSSKAINSEIPEDENNNVTVPAEWLKLSESSSNYKIEIYIQSMSATNSNEKSEPNYLPSFTGYLLITKK